MFPKILTIISYYFSVHQLTILYNGNNSGRCEDGTETLHKLWLKIRGLQTSNL
jgi:hypothetical protein